MCRALHLPKLQDLLDSLCGLRVLLLQLHSSSESIAMTSVFTFFLKLAASSRNAMILVSSFSGSCFRACSPRGVCGGLPLSKSMLAHDMVERRLETTTSSEPASHTASRNLSAPPASTHHPTDHERKSSTERCYTVAKFAGVEVHIVRAWSRPVRSLDELGPLALAE